MLQVKLNYVCVYVYSCIESLFFQTTYLHQPTHREKLAHYLEHRSKEGVIDSETVADHQRLNRNMISKKMGEVTRLQNSLTDQAKVCHCSVPITDTTTVLSLGNFYTGFSFAH